MYYVDYLEMITSFLESSLDSVSPHNKLSNHKRLSVKKKNYNLIKPMLASIFLLLCIIVVPEKPSALASVCEKYNSSTACQVW